VIADQVGASRAVQTTTWKKYPCTKHVVIFLLFPATASQIQTATFVIYKPLETENDEGESGESSGPDEPNLTFELIPLDKYGIESRRDLMSFWWAYHSHASAFWNGYPVLHSLPEPLADTSAPSFVGLFSGKKTMAVVLRIPLFTFLKVEDGEISWNRNQDAHVPSEQKSLCHPDQPFHYESLQWQTAAPHGVS
jgi:hypothetical protein